MLEPAVGDISRGKVRVAHDRDEIRIEPVDDDNFGRSQRAELFLIASIERGFQEALRVATWLACGLKASVPTGVGRAA